MSTRFSLEILLKARFYKNNIFWSVFCHTFWIWGLNLQNLVIGVCQYLWKVTIIQSCTKFHQNWVKIAMKDFLQPSQAKRKQCALVLFQLFSLPSYYVDVVWNIIYHINPENMIFWLKYSNFKLCRVRL